MPFYVPDGDRFVATEETRGPWSPDHQHGGPPSALLGRSIQRELAGRGLASRIARITVEFLKPVPIETLVTSVEIQRGGRKVQTLIATLSTVDRTMVARASALCVRTDETLEPTPNPAPPVAPRPLAESPPWSFPFFRWPTGYHTAMELRLARGTFGQGSMACWMRPRVQLVEGEELSPLERVLVCADSGNGLSVLLDLSRFTFLNPDLTVVLHRTPVGEWVCVDAVTLPGPDGIGSADAALYDDQGPIGRSVQTLLIDRV
jgi:hypothetical protein